MKIRKLLGTALVLAVSLSLMASSAPSSHAGKSWTLRLPFPAHVGSALLPAGYYTVQQLNDGDDHILVFKGDKKEIARAHCTMENLSEKPKNALLTFDRNSAGERVLVAIAFPGDSVQHDLKP